MFRSGRWEGKHRGPVSAGRASVRPRRVSVAASAPPPSAASPVLPALPASALPASPVVPGSPVVPASPAVRASPGSPASPVVRVPEVQVRQVPLAVGEGRPQVRFADRVYARTATEARNVRSSWCRPSVCRASAPSSRCPAGDAHCEYGWTSIRAIARQLRVSASGSTNQAATRWRGRSAGTGRASATAPSAHTASAACRTCRTAAATVPAPSGTARPARTSPSARPRTASAAAAAARTGAIGDWPPGPMAPSTVRSISSRARGSTTVAQPVWASSSRRWRAMETSVRSATRRGPPDRKAAS